MLNIRKSLPISCALALLGACHGSSTDTSGASDIATTTTDMTSAPTTTDTAAPTTTDTTSGGDGSVEPAGTSLFLQVFDALGNPIPIAAVTFEGVTRATNGAGQILFEQLAPGRFAARVEAYGYAAATAVTELPEGAHGGMELRLLPLGDSLPFDADAGGTLEQGAVRVTIPPQALVDPNGEPVTGMVEATIVPLDPTSDISASPGPLAGIPTQGGGEVGLESVFMAEISLWQAGNRLQLKPGAKATLEMVLPESLQGQYVDGDTVPAWWFDLDAGIWKEDGAGTMGPSQSQPDKLAWTAEVEHFTWWNCDQPWTNKNCFDVLVVDMEGDPVANSFVSAQGVSYVSLSGGKVASPDGHACIDIKLSGTADLLVGGSELSNMPAVIQQVTGVGPASSCSGMGAACGTVVIMVPDGSACVPGASRACPYMESVDTLDVGVCQAATDFCNAQGTAWIGCSGAVLPTPENCNTAFDEDCDDLVNEEGPGCNCVPGLMTPCYTGPNGTIDVGVCQGGLRQCNPDGIGHGPCVGQVVPTADLCATPEDEDCDEDASCIVPPLWEKPTDGTATGVALSVAADDDGNVLATGSFSGTLDLGAGPLIGLDDVFLAKFDADGNTQWSKRFGDDSSAQYGRAVAADGDGNIILSGYFQGTLDLGGGPLVSLAMDGFVAKFNSAGDHLWSKNFPRAVAEEVAVGPAGNVVVAGIFLGMTNLGGGVIMSAGGSDIYMVELDAAGDHVWSRSFGDINAAQSTPSVAMDASGAVVLAGNLIGTLDFGGGPLTANLEQQNIFVARFDTDGGYLWSERFGDGMTQSLTGLALDSLENIVVSTSGGAIDFGDGLRGPGEVVARLAPTGAHQWSAEHPLEKVRDIAVDSAGNIASVGSGKVAKIDSTGGLLWNRSIAAGPDPSYRRVVFDRQDNPIVAGQVAGRPFIAKLAP